MNKKTVIRGTVFALLLLLTVFFLRTRDITEIYDNNVDEINSIKLMDGSNGNIKELTDRDDIQKVIEYLASLTMRKRIYIIGTGGWSYRIIIKCKNGDVLRFAFLGDGFTINNSSYSFKTDMDLFIDGIIYR